MERTHLLIPKVKQLQLPGVLDTLEARHRPAIDGQWAYIEFLERVLEGEIERRAQTEPALRVQRVALNTTRTLEGFDWTFTATMNRQ